MIFVSNWLLNDDVGGKGHRIPGDTAGRRFQNGRFRSRKAGGGYLRTTPKRFWFRYPTPRAAEVHSFVLGLLTRKVLHLTQNIIFEFSKLKVQFDEQTLRTTHSTIEVHHFFSEVP